VKKANAKRMIDGIIAKAQQNVRDAKLSETEVDAVIDEEIGSERPSK